MYFSIWDSNTYIFNIILFFKWFYARFIERKTQSFILKCRKSFLWRETVLEAHGMKPDEKPFLSNLCDFLRTNGTCSDWQIFCFFISERFEDFSKPEAIIDSPFKFEQLSCIQKQKIPDEFWWVCDTTSQCILLALYLSRVTIGTRLKLPFVSLHFLQVHVGPIQTWKFRSRFNSKLYTLQ